MGENDVISVSVSLESIARFLEEKSDPRTREWFLVGSFNTLFAILALYVIFSVKIGPQLMKDRKPFELKKILLVYNTLNILASGYIFIEGCRAGWLTDYSFLCQPVDYSTSPKAMRMAGLVWVYYMIKLFDLADTVFFVLRKKNSQVSFLHLYHHTFMPVLGYVGVRYLPGGHGTLLGVINSLVHVVMYSYYLLAALGPAYQKYLWWKRYITIMQLVQFVIILIHLGQVLFRDCDFPKPMVMLACINDVMLIYLFASFYCNTYNKKKTT